MKEDNLIQIYNQHWEQARHIEQERMWFGNIFVAIIAGVLAIVKSEILSVQLVPLTVFLMAFSLFGIIFSIKLWTCYMSHVNSAYSIIEKNDNESNKEVMKYVRPQFTTHWIRSVKVSRLFPLFYNICLNGFLFLLGFQTGIQCYIFWIIFQISFFVISFSIIWKLEFYKTDNKEIS
ncbi:MAG: hypothetical protein HYY40_00665 [Bacteroidetes bacterium]|nr:hypothetical protein [Bacteroidota bacterium]